ncbi:MAG: hypothetical protein U9M92_00625 [Patescibacteria group bacterium]|nr:hypothetical protein [Patescibacteria group bacterium]
MLRQLTELKIGGVSSFEKLLETKNSSFWQRRGEARALKLFHLAADRVPAYKDFLNKHQLIPREIRTISDFKDRVPITDKSDYVKKYPLKDRCWDGNLASNNLIALSSGTSGEPIFWPRQSEQDLEALITHELIYKHLFAIHKRKTLIIIGFPMGFYVSGVATLLPTWLFSMRKYGSTVVSAGNNKDEILRTVKELSKDYEQTLLIGHPFFIKDVVETGANKGVRWKSLDIKMLYCSEGFSELWRSYIKKRVGSESDLNAAINTYGSSELLLMGCETPLTIVARKFFEKNSRKSRAVFGQPQSPQLFQYNPALRYIEESERGNLIFTANGGVPLIRFDLQDAGRIFDYDEFASTLEGGGLDWKKDLRVGGATNPWRLPLIAFYGRSDQTVIFYAANIYPGHVHMALARKNLLSRITGKFTIIKKPLPNHEQCLVVNIEMRKDTKGTSKIRAEIKKAVCQTLLKANSEYSDTVKHHPDKNLSPRVKLWSYQHEKYFKPGLKPKYISN